RVPLHEEDVPRSRTRQALVYRHVRNERGQIRKSVRESAVTVPVDLQRDGDIPLSGQDSLRGGRTAVRLHYASNRVKLALRKGKRGEVVLTWSTRTSRAAGPISQSVATVPTSS